MTIGGVGAAAGGNDPPIVGTAGGGTGSELPTTVEIGAGVISADGATTGAAVTTGATLGAAVAMFIGAGAAVAVGATSMVAAGTAVACGSVTEPLICAGNAIIRSSPPMMTAPATMPVAMTAASFEALGTWMSAETAACVNPKSCPCRGGCIRSRADEQKPFRPNDRARKTSRSGPNLVADGLRGTTLARVR
jgi:hypothetical protein